MGATMSKERRSTGELPAAARRELVAALGDRNVSDDPAFMVSYAWSTTTGGEISGGQLCQHRPIAVVLPSSTEEVQAVVKTCLRHGLKFRAHSTGTASFHQVLQDDVVSIDLRRMDKIVDLDASNQMAVIEPYVTAAQLQAEAMKVGLTTHIIGAGWTHSPLASATSMAGPGISGHHTGVNFRNLLAYEWVTPEGDIVRAGSLGSEAGWFAGEGPGPGFRGMIRGSAGAFGGLGVFTRIGYKLHPWHGSPSLDHRGVHPQIGVGLSDRLRVYQPVWDDWKGPMEAAYGFLNSNAPTLVVRIPPDQYGWILTATNQEFYDRLRSGTLPEIARNENRISWTLVAISETVQEAEWRERTIRAIVEKSGGRFLDLAPGDAEVIARNAITACYVPRTFRAGPRQIMSCVGVYDSFGLLPEMVKTAERLMAPYLDERKTFVEGGPEEFWIWPTEGRHLWAENIIVCDNDTAKSVGDGYAFAIQTIEENERHPIGLAAFAQGPMLGEIYAKRFNTYQWMGKVKAMFDPAGAADGMYPSGKPTPVGKLWPYLRPVFARFPGVLRWMLRMQVKSAR